MKTIRISNNLSSICIIGDNNQPNALRDNMTELTLGSNITEIGPSCCINCSQLTALNAKNFHGNIKEYAFYNCSTLKDVSFLNEPGHYIDNFEKHCFDGCDALEEIYITLSSTNRETAIEEYSFANCKNLKTVTWSNSSLLATNAFAGCTSLSKLNISHFTSYVYPKALANIPNITEITIPSNIWILNEGMFENDVNLTAVNIEDTVDSRLQHVYANSFYNCQKLTSITLPQSITSFSQIDPFFLSGSNISQVTLNGMISSAIVTKYKKAQKYTYEPGKLYITAEHASSISQIPKLTKTIAMADAINVCKYAEKNHIPLVVIYATTGCDNCKTIRATLASSCFLDFLKTHKKLEKTIYLLTSDQTVRQSSWYSAIPIGSGLSLPFIAMHWWDKKHNHFDKYDVGAASHNPTQLYEYHLKAFEKSLTYYGDDNFKEVIIYNDQLSKLGSPLDSIKFITKDGKSAVIDKQSSVSYPPIPRVDKSTTDNFKYGTWYYNARELKAFADKNKIPVLVEFSDEGCPPCINFKETIYNNTEFQDWVEKSPYLFCRVETEQGQKFSNPKYEQPYFVDFEWARQQPNYDQKMSIPVLMWYWKDSNNDNVRVWDMMTYHFSPGAAAPITWKQLTEMTDQKFAEYRKNNNYKKFIVSSLYTKAGSLIGKYYENQANDNNGKYFICDKKTSTSKQYQATIDIQGTSKFSSVKAFSNVKKNDTVDSHMAGYTFQYFTTPQSMQYYLDSQGVIFKVDGNAKIEYVYSFTNDNEGAKVERKYSYSTWYDMSNTDIEKFNEIIYEAENVDKPVVIFKDSSSQLKSVKTDNDFVTYMTSYDAYFIYINTTNWDTGIGQALQQFIMAQNRQTGTEHFNNWTPETPMIYGYIGCLACSEGDLAAVQKAGEIKNTTLASIIIPGLKSILGQN